MTQETAHERTAIDFTEFDKAIEETSIFTHVEDAMWVTDKAHELIKVNNSVSTDEILVEKLQEQLKAAKKALTEISNHYLTDESYDGDADYREIAINALAELEGGENDR